LVQRAEDWPWSTIKGTEKQGDVMLSAWPIPKPADWMSFFNPALTIKELEELRVSTQ
jgi:hypothetical protein